MKVSDYVVKFLEAQRVTHVFELSGGMITHLLDSFARLSSIHVVSMHHEQGAAFAAEGWARMTGVPAVAMATSGPGATNLLTAIGSCYFDSTPGVFITGQVNRHEMKGTRAIRQLGFQETDIVPMAEPITKKAVKVMDADRVPQILKEAFEIAMGGRPGPVLVDIPMDVQRESIEVSEPQRVELRAPDASRVDANALSALEAMLRESARPLFLLGGGVRSSRTSEACRRLLERLAAPAVVSLMGVDVLGNSDPLRVGMLGSYGNRWANLAIARSDLLIVVGSRLDVRQTGADAKGFAAGRKVVHVDCEPGEINNRVPTSLPIVAELKDFFAAMERRPPLDLRWDAWRKELGGLKSQWPDTRELFGLEGLNPNVFMHVLGAGSTGASAFAVDVGQHQMWAAQSLPLTAKQRFLTSGGMGSMGFGLPAAIGAALATPGQPVVLIAGDGGFQNNIQELQVIVRNRLPVKVVIMNNRSHGMVRQFQESYFESRFQSTVDGYDAPDFVRVAEAYGIRAQRLELLKGASSAQADEAMKAAVQWLWDPPEAPSLLEVMTPIAANVYPKMAFGRPITEMEPQAKPLDMEGT